MSTEDQWHGQLLYRVFIVWGYGPWEGWGVRHVDRERRVYNLAEGRGLCFVDRFELPEVKGLPEPQVYERKHCWGWRFISSDGVNATNWRLADTSEQAMKAMREYAQEEFDTMPRVWRRARIVGE